MAKAIRQRYFWLDREGRLVVRTGHVYPVRSNRRRIVVLRSGAVKTSVPLGRLVCWLARGAPPTKRHVADHRDGDVGNDCPSNLRWCTGVENSANTRHAREGHGGPRASCRKCRVRHRAWVNRQKRKGVGRA